MQVPTCGASRYSLMTGMRPRKRIHVDNKAFYEETSQKPERERPESLLKRNQVGKFSLMPTGMRRFTRKWKRMECVFAYANGDNKVFRLNDEETSQQP